MGRKEGEGKKKKGMSKKRKVEAVDGEMLVDEDGRGGKRYIFQTVQLKVIRRWKKDGKWKQQTVKFEQTQSPFSKDKEGNVKSREQIIKELYGKREKWQKKHCSSNDKISSQINCFY